MAELKMPRVMIVAPGSGSGKTMITCGLLELLRREGKPISFKCGPDYIDPMFHRFVLNIPSRNLDTFFTASDRTRSLMGKACMKERADLAVIEGVMGYYDGLGGVSVRGSSYELSVQTRTPVILAVNGRGMSLSIVALIRGFMSMYPDQMIRGVILNRVSKVVCERLTPIIEEKLGIAVIGYVPETEVICFPSRHLGLMMPAEIVSLLEQIQKFASLLEETLDIRKLKTIAEGADPLSWDEAAVTVQNPEAVNSGQTTNADKTINADKAVGLCRPFGIEEKLRIGVAMDAAFCFYYEDNLDLLRELGAEIVYFSPLKDAALPEHLSGLYMGGGYPELYGEQLSRNESMKQSIRGAVEGGMPCLAECGAFMYLHEEMEDADGRFWPMVGLVPGKAVKKGRLVRFGYAVLTAETDTILGPKGMQMPVHEFHYWDTTCEESCFEAHKPLTERRWHCIYQKKQLLTGFPHFYFYGNETMAVHYMEACMKYHDRFANTE